MIYLDNAATTRPKPPGVLRAMTEAVTRYGANPGRGGYSLAELTDRRLYDCRKRAAEFFGLGQPEQLIYTPGCTWSINTVLRGCLRPGDHVIISDIEHNAVVRPLHVLEQKGISVSRAHVTEGDDAATLRSFRSAIRMNTRMIFCTCASNVFGTKPPISLLGGLCRRYGLLFGIDAAQTAGTDELTANDTGAHFICAPAHKGLYGIMGLGVLALSGDVLPEPLICGGTGTLSALRRQPDVLPDRYESGTPGMPAICALDAGLEFIGSVGSRRIRAHETDIAAHIYDGLRSIGGTVLYTQWPEGGSHAPLISFNMGDLSGSEGAELLARRGICVRGGYHCAYDAHVAYGTGQRGTIRVSPSVFTTHEEAEALLRAVREYAK